MLRFVVRRLLLLVPILLGLSILVFLWIRALPGGPAESLLGERATPEAIEQIERTYGLDRPIWEQYLKYLQSLAQGELGTSISSRRPVTEEIGRRFPATVELALAAMIFATALGVPLGFVAAKRYGGAVDHGSLVASLIGISIPIFFLAILLKYVFAVQLGLSTDDRPAGRPHRRRPPDRVLRPRRDHHAQPGVDLGRDRASDPSRPSRSARSRLRSSRGSRAPPCSTCKTRTTCEPRARRASPRGSSTSATSSGTRCCRSSRSSACRPACCSRGRSSPRRSSRSRGWARGSRRRSATATTRCSRVGSSSSPSSSCS